VLCGGARVLLLLRLLRLGIPWLGWAVRTPAGGSLAHSERFRHANERSGVCKPGFGQHDDLHCCMLWRVQATEAALLHAAEGAGVGDRAAACFAGCRRRPLRCCMLRRVQAKEVALLHAAEGAGEGGCAAACCGG
jgi:hypothetical protein